MNIVIIKENKRCELASALLKARLLMDTAGDAELIFIVCSKNDQTMCQNLLHGGRKNETEREVTECVCLPRQRGENPSLNGSSTSKDRGEKNGESLIKQN